MSETPLAPEDILIVEMPKLDDAIRWLVAFVNRELKANSLTLMNGGESVVQFRYSDFVYSYRYVPYWREHYREIAAMFREQGWQVTEYDLFTPVYARQEAQPSLGFKVATDV